METMMIQGTQIQIKEYMGQRVVTLKDVDTVHQRVSGSARKRFNDNRKHFIETVDFYRVTQPSEIRTLGVTRPQAVEIDTTKMLLEMSMQGIDLPTLAKKASVSVTAIMSWIKGNHKPLEVNRSNICAALGKNDDFLTPKRKRNVKS